MLNQYKSIERKIFEYPLRHDAQVPEPFAAALIREAMEHPCADECKILFLQLLHRTAPSLMTIGEKIQYVDLLDNYLKPILPTLRRHLLQDRPIPLDTLRTRNSDPSIHRQILLHADLLPYLGRQAARIPHLLPTTASVPVLNCAPS